MQFKIRTKLIIAFLAIILPFIAIGGAIALYNVNTIRKASLKAEAISEEMHTVLSLQLAIDKSLMPGNDYIITGDKKYIDDFNDASKDVEDLIKKVEDAFTVLKGMDTPEVREEMKVLKSVRTSWQNIKEDSQRIYEIRNPVGNKEAQRLMEEMDYKWAYPVIRMLDKYHEIDRKEHAEAIEVLRRAWMMAWVIMIGGAVILISFGVFFALFYSRLFTRPIQVIHTRADAITKGEFKTRLDIKTGDEFQQLANAMNEMAAQLDSLYSNLEQKVEERTRKLKESEERHRQIIQTSMDGFWITDTRGRILDVNDAYCQMIGYEREEILNMCIPNVEAKETPEETAQHIQEVMAKGYARFETRHRRKDGRLLDVEVSVVYRPEGENGYFFIFLRDITESKQAEEKTKEHLDYLERFQKVALKREFRIKELTNEIEKLKTELEELKKRNI